MYKIVIIGAGQLGSRHLQALLKIKLPVAIEVMDSYQVSLDNAKSKAAEIQENFNIKSVKYVLSLDELSKDIDICIVATTANVRSDVVKHLIAKSKVKNLILEKVLFQKIEDYQPIANLLKINAINCWVNCPRRLFPIYQHIKSLIEPNEKITYTVIGGDWGLACNAIHFIDHLSSLNGNTNFKFEKIGITDVVKGRRQGYFELLGTLYGKQDNGSDIFLHSRKDSNANLSIQIFSEKYLWHIDESRGELKTYFSGDNWMPVTTSFTIPYQSELTNLVCEDILLNGKSDLPTYQESKSLHQAMMETFQEIFAEKLNIRDLCPIT